VEPAVTDLVISDLHLGSRRRRDVLAREAPRAPLLALAREVDRVVLLGDLLELLEAPVPEALHAARPLLRALGRAVPEVVYVPGNHDRELVAGWLAARRSGSGPLALDQPLPVEAHPALTAIAEAVAPARLELRYPGLWLRDDVYATHGHYLDRHLTFPPELEAALPGALGGLARRGLDPPGSPDDYEQALGPAYEAWQGLRRQEPPPYLAASRQLATALAERLSDAALPLVGRLGAGAALAPLSAGLLGHELGRSGLRAMAEVARRLGVEADHVVFGHIHRCGPRPDEEDLRRWVTPEGVSLANSGCWVFEPLLLAGAGGESPYWPGAALLVPESGPPELRRLLADWPAEDLRRPADPAPTP
jgi:predicted phosphodiesterase